nr:MAG TPA: hypothetical protein [Caudoviricetes sp.]
MDVPKRKTIGMIFLHPKFQRNSSKKVEADLGQPYKRSPEVYLGLPRIRTAPNRQQFNFKLAHTVS